MTAKKLKRRYVYEEDHNTLMAWGKHQVKVNRIDPPPNNRDDFPHYLRNYLMMYHSKGGK